MSRVLRCASVAVSTLFAAGCGGSSDADADYVGGECTVAEDCGEEALECLTDFRGGYCGTQDCTSDDDCLEGSMCVTVGAENYCFLICLDKVDCNNNRTVENESNCSSNILRVGESNDKACVPPSGG